LHLSIDFSVFLPTRPAGAVSGTIDFTVLPRVGESVSFLHPKHGVLPVKLARFSGMLKVEHLTHPANSLDVLTGLSLESITVESATDVEALAKFLEEGFGLSFSPHD